MKPKSFAEACEESLKNAKTRLRWKGRSTQGYTHVGCAGARDVYVAFRTVVVSREDTDLLRLNRPVEHDGINIREALTFVTDQDSDRYITDMGVLERRRSEDRLSDGSRLSDSLCRVDCSPVRRYRTGKELFPALS